MNHIKPKIGLKNNFDKLLFVLATVYLMSVMAWIWKQHQTKQIISQLPPINNNSESQSNNNNILPLNQENIPLPNNQINLLSVDNKTSNSSSLTPPPPLPSLSQLPSPNNTLTIPPLPNTQKSANLSEVSPLPIPQPPSPISISSPPPPLSLNNTVKSSPISPPPPPPQKLTKVPVISSPHNNISPPNNENNNTITMVSLPSETSKETNYNYTLLGVIQLGNSDSIAMFNINNITEKVSIGSEIGTTGWVLMGINDKQAIISRHNQSIYVRVGETF